MFIVFLKRSVDYGKQHAWHGHVLRSENGQFGIKEEREIENTWKKKVEEEGMKVGLRREDALCQSN